MKEDFLKTHPELALAPSATLRDAMAALTLARVDMAMVVDAQRLLLGVVSDVDIRSCLLKNGTLETRVDAFMNKTPVTMPEALSRAQIAEFFRAHPKAHIPVVDKNGRLAGLRDIRDYSEIPPHYANTVVIMAGGLGQRLGPLTAHTPKPMLPLGDKPILEVLLEQFRESGFTNFLFAVNYLADQIMGHFKDGSAWGVRVEYLREDKPLGTVGALSLIERAPAEPLLVANGDIVTKVNFKALLNFHTGEKASATLCIKPHEIQVPYGVVEVDGHQLRSFVEKPTKRTYINAGIYVIEPEVLAWIPKNERRDMPWLIAEIQKRRQNAIACFPIQEYWMDIGEVNAYRRAGDDYSKNFE